MAEEMGESRNQIQRFIRFTNLIPELLDLVDQRKSPSILLWSCPIWQTRNSRIF